MQRYLLPSFMCLALAACASQPLTSDNAPVASQLDVIPVTAGQSGFPQPGTCQSVKLFKKVNVTAPSSAVPASQAKFSGRWGNGRWGNVLCQDIHVLRIHSDGTAEIFDGQGPYEPWGVWASGYMRKAVFIPAVDDRGDIMRVEHNDTIIDYWVKGNTMYGVRQEKNGDQLRITMARKPN